MLAIWLDLCRRSGIEEVAINLHAHTGLVRHALRDHKGSPEVRIIEEDTLLGSAGTLLSNRDWVAKERDFWVLYADVLTNLNFKRMLEDHRRAQLAATLGLYLVKEPKRCGIVQFDENNVVRDFEEKPRRPKSNWAFSGVLLGTAEFLDAIPQQTPIDLGYSVLPRLVDRMLAFPISDYVLDVGTMGNYQLAQQTWPGLPAEAEF